MPAKIAVTHFTDPGCPWAYSASPAHALLRWRYGDQLDWKLTLIGLTEDGARYVERGYTPTLSAQGYRRFRSYGMPFAGQPRERMTGTGRMCRVVVAARLRQPGLDLQVFRALQLAQFTTTHLLDTDEGLRGALLPSLPAEDVDALIAAIEDPAVEAAYQEDRAAARTAEGGPTEAQGKAANTDGAVRFTAPSLVFTTADGRSLEAGGFQPVEAYDVCLANLEPTLERRPPAQDPVEVLRALPYAPTTREVAVCLAEHLGEPDDDAAEAALIAAAGQGLVERRGIGSGALWHLAGAASAAPLRRAA